MLIWRSFYPRRPSNYSHQERPDNQRGFVSLAGINAVIFHLPSRCANHYIMETDAARRLTTPHQNKMENLEEGSPTDFHKAVLESLSVLIVTDTTYWNDLWHYTVYIWISVFQNAYILLHCWLQKSPRPERESLIFSCCCWCGQKMTLDCSDRSQTMEAYSRLWSEHFIWSDHLAENPIYT